ncbi:hypothetical protein JCM21900_001787, partial [Sporobolomyces salmonicolor]
MAIAPIQGTLRKGAITHISTALGGGLVCAYWFWYGHHIAN